MQAAGADDRHIANTQWEMFRLLSAVLTRFILIPKCAWRQACFEEKVQPRQLIVAKITIFAEGARVLDNGQAAC
jgi:hypothetical protein